MTAAMPATREPGPGGCLLASPCPNSGVSEWTLEIAVTIITDFAGYTDDELRAACDHILNHPGAPHEILHRAEKVLEAIGGKA